MKPNRKCLMLVALCGGLASSPLHAEEDAASVAPPIDDVQPSAVMVANAGMSNLPASNNASVTGTGSSMDDLSQTEDQTEAAGTDPEGKALTFIVSPYVWIPNVSGNIGVGSSDGQFVLDTGDLLDLFEFGGLIRGEVRHRSGWGVSVDYMFADLGAGVDIVIGDVDADINASILEATLVRRVELDSGSLDLYGGIRRWDAEIQADITTPFFSTTVATGDRWVDPIIGARYQHQLSPRWKILGQADVGGFGMSSDFTWNVAAGASYEAWSNTSFQFVYRVLDVDRTSGEVGTPSAVDLGITIQGPLIGFAYRF